MVSRVTGGGGAVQGGGVILKSKKSNLSEKAEGEREASSKDVVHFCACAMQKEKQVCFVPPRAKSKGGNAKEKQRLRFPGSEEDVNT